MSDQTERREERGVGETTTAAAAAAATTGATERPLSEHEKSEVKVASTPVASAAGAVAGATAGLATGVFGPFGAIVGAIVGALGGAAAGGAHAGAADDLYTTESDAYYQSLWESSADRPADRRFESVRPAYQFGHIAARQAAFTGRDFAAVEPELRQRWPEQFRTTAGDWDASRRYVETAYSYSGEQALAARRDPTVIGSAGSAVNPAELERARDGMPSADR